MNVPLLLYGTNCSYSTRSSVGPATDDEAGTVL
jgi:hypothetical protein